MPKDATFRQWQVGKLAMVFPMSRTIVARTEAEVDAALGSASRIVVEGDDALLSYAMARASGDPEASVVAQTPPRSVSVSGRVVERAAAAGRWRGALRLLAWLLPCLALALAAFWLLAHQNAAPQLTAEVERPQELEHAAEPSQLSEGLTASNLANPTERGITPARPPAPVPPPALVPETSGRDASAEMNGLAWPVVVIVGILAVYLLARQAVASGRDVEISWNVSEKVAGRLVITKVRGRDRTARAAA